MSGDEVIVNRLCGAFPFLSDRIYIQQAMRIFTKPLAKVEFEQIIPFVYDELGFRRACHVVGTDDGDAIGLLYILADPDSNLLILRESVPKTESFVKSISDRYPVHRFA